jgi:hypothetical protein
LTVSNGADHGGKIPTQQPGGILGRQDHRAGWHNVYATPLQIVCGLSGLCPASHVKEAPRFTQPRVFLIRFILTVRVKLSLAIVGVSPDTSPCQLGNHGVLSATGMTLHDRLAILPFGDVKGWLVIIMRRAFAHTRA